MPSLTLSYSTGVGNGPFGLGWSVAPPAVWRKTEKGIPAYNDESDTFVVSGWEDLVSLGAGEYRPRVDTAFARIRHVRSATEDHWVVVRPDGLRHVYGADASSRIYDESTGRHRALAWYLSETQDPCGNRILYSYKPDRTGDPKGPINQTYLKSVRYAEYGTDPSDPSCCKGTDQVQQCGIDLARLPRVVDRNKDFGQARSVCLLHRVSLLDKEKTRYTKPGRAEAA